MDTNNEDRDGSERLLRRTEAAAYVTETYFPCAARTLAKVACLRSDGPPFRMVGRVPLYARTSLDEWARRKIGPLVRSTSEASRRRAT